MGRGINIMATIVQNIRQMQKIIPRHASIPVFYHLFKKSIHPL